MQFQTNNPTANRLYNLLWELCSIPRASYHEDPIVDHLCGLLEDKKVQYTRDASNNLVFTIPASPDKADCQPVILQGHTDMVFVTDDQHKDHLHTQPLVLKTDGEYLWAEGTSLGADDAVSIPIMLALLDEDFSHPAIECVLTTQEEVGLNGAKALDKTLLKGKRMINLDNEEEGFGIVGCAGGVSIALEKSYTALPVAGPGLSLCLRGLKGGHSGMEIQNLRLNANKWMAQLLEKIPTPYVLCDFRGGTVDNAIPSVCRVEVVPKGDPALFRTQVLELSEQLLAPHRSYEPDAQFSVEAAQPTRGLDYDCTKELLSLIQKAPHGVIEAMADGAVLTSINAATVSVSQDTLCLVLSCRSAKNEQKQALCQQVEALGQSLGFHATLSGDYPGWAPREDSSMQTAYENAFAKVYGRLPRCQAIHAGLECGVFADAIADFDAISLGPNNLNIHTPKERLELASLERTYRVVVEMLKKL